MEILSITREEIIQMLNEVFPDPVPLLEDECKYACPHCGHVIRVPKHVIDTMCELVPNTNPITQMPMIRCVNCNHDDPRWFLHIHIHKLNEKPVVFMNVTPEQVDTTINIDSIPMTGASQNRRSYYG